MSVLGQVTIRVNNQQIKSKKGWTLNAAGYNTTEHNGPDCSWGVSREYVNPTLTGPIAAADDVDVMEINAITDATIVWDGDNGISYLITGCCPQSPFTVSDSGDIQGTFRGDKMEKL